MTSLNIFLDSRLASTPSNLKKIWGWHVFNFSHTWCLSFFSLFCSLYYNKWERLRGGAHAVGNSHDHGCRGPPPPTTFLVRAYHKHMHLWIRECGFIIFIPSSQLFRLRIPRCATCLVDKKMIKMEWIFYEQWNNSIILRDLFLE